MLTYLLIYLPVSLSLDQFDAIIDIMSLLHPIVSYSIHFNVALDNDTVVCSGLSIEPNFSDGDGGNANANVSGDIFQFDRKGRSK